MTKKSHILSGLYKMRTIHPKVKLILDHWRGKLACSWLTHASYASKSPSLSGMQELIRYLQSTTEYTEEIIRIKQVIKFIHTYKSGERQEKFEAIAALAGEFEVSSRKRLHIFTQQVDPYWESESYHYLGKENYFFAGRKPVEYHLNMVGAELMNRALRPAFREVKQLVILAPTCMCKGLYC